MLNLGRSEQNTAQKFKKLLVTLQIIPYISGVTEWVCTVLRSVDANGNILTRQMLELLSDNENATRDEGSNKCLYSFVVFLPNNIESYIYFCANMQCAGWMIL